MKFEKYNETFLTSFFLVTLSWHKKYCIRKQIYPKYSSFLVVYTTYVNMMSSRARYKTVVKKKKKDDRCANGKQENTNPYILNIEVTIKTLRQTQGLSPFRENRLESFTKQLRRFWEARGEQSLRLMALLIQQRTSSKLKLYEIIIFF